MRAAIARGSGNYQLHDAMILRALQYGIEIVSKRLMGEIGADIYEFHVKASEAGKSYFLRDCCVTKRGNDQFV